MRRRGSELPAERGGGRPFSAAHGGGFYHLLVSLEMDLGKGLLGRCLSALLRGDPLLSSCASFCSVCVWVCFFFVCFVCFSWDPTDSLSRRLHCRALVRVIAFYRKTDLRPHRIVFLVPFHRLPNTARTIQPRLRPCARYSSVFSNSNSDTAADSSNRDDFRCAVSHKNEQ